MRPANMTKLDTHIADLQTKLRQAESRKKDAIARQNAALKKKARQEDTRKKNISRINCIKSIHSEQ